MRPLWVAVVCALVALSVAASEETFDARADELVRTINSGNHGWTAKASDRFKGMTLSQIKDTMGCGDLDFAEAIKHIPLAPAPNETEIAQLPKTFDSANTPKWPTSCIHAIRDQGQCGSCWAFAVSESFSDRLCCATGGASNHVLSPQQLVACDNGAWYSPSGGCGGGYLSPAWSYTASPGLYTDGCIPYTSAGGSVPACGYNKCQDGSAWSTYKSIAGSVQTMPNVAAIQSSITTYGPVSACFTIYEDFVNYHSGVYHHTSGANLGGHCVKITGWGSNYWIVANSWGTGWGQSGWFYIQMGNNECGIESSVTVGRA